MPGYKSLPLRIVSGATGFAVFCTAVYFFATLDLTTYVQIGVGLTGLAITAVTWLLSVIIPN